MTIDKLNFVQFAAKYCERQLSDPATLLEIFRTHKTKWQCDGWFMLECQMMGGSKLGQLTIVPYGPNNTFKSVPDHPISPRGQASDMSVVVATLDASEVA